MKAIKHIFLSLLPLLSIGVAVAQNSEGEMLAKRQCRSVHLGYKAPPAEWAVIEVSPKLSAPGTYFCAMGFNSGYFGFQELGDGKKVVIFSVWDKAKPGHNDRDQSTIPESERVGVLKVGEGVRPMRFGGEGTGSKSFFDYDWEIGETLRFAVQAKPEGKLTTFTGYFFDNKRKQWQLMAKFRTELGQPIRGLYSFIEDFRRNFQSAKIARRAEYLNCWVKPNKGEWQAASIAKFTADGTPSNTIDAGPIKGSQGFFLQTGGDTEMKTTKLWAEMKTQSAEMPEWVKQAPQLPAMSTHRFSMSVASASRRIPRSASTTASGCRSSTPISITGS